MNIGEYLDQVRHAFESGQATEHSYRPALHALFESIDPKLTVINEPKKSEGGMPDFLFQRGDVPFGWAEAKDIDKDVIKLKGYSKEQRKRYEAAYPNLIYPPSPEVFRHISEKGEQLRRLHLMELAAIGDTPYPYAGEGDDVVASGYPKWDKGHVYINKDQYFTDVPKIAWEFYIGGYQPAQKWLKDRRARALSFDDITHYQRVVKILAETDRIMKEIELPLQ